MQLPDKHDPCETHQLIGELEDLRSEMLNLVKENMPAIAEIHLENRASASNLLHYLALRRHDVRDLQERLAALGLSSLGRTEAHVMSALHTVMDALARLSGSGCSARTIKGPACEREEGRQLLERNTCLLLGPDPEHRNVRIMVTVPFEASTDYELVRDLLAGGMNCMRINCAHDTEEAWLAMIRNLRKAEEETGKHCKIAMDLAGPKLRTGPIESGPAVVKFRPKRDSYGRVIFPARIWLTSISHPETSPKRADACLPVSERWLSQLKQRDSIRLVDARGARRSMTICEAFGKSCWAESTQTTYIAPGLLLNLKVKDNPRTTRGARVGEIAPKTQSLELKVGDTLVLTRSLEPGRPALYDESNELVSPARIGVTLPEFFDSVQPGEPIWLDDGKIGATVSKVEADHVTIEIKQAPAGRAKLGAEKGINAPETNLQVTALTEDDLKALEFAVKHADILEYSFVRTEDDVRQLQTRLEQLGADKLGIVLKIETRQGFENLPSLLLAAMRNRAIGVMIARGDLAVECGYERLAEVQEEILWISEAAHVPVIWAAQVLELLAKTGRPSRSEITDAAMGERAECVMLNKGPYVVEAVKTLDNILRRMQAHQEKKRSMLRKLQIATGFGNHRHDEATLTGNREIVVETPCLDDFYPKG
jgi:pyruvate kinase